MRFEELVISIGCGNFFVCNWMMRRLALCMTGMPARERLLLLPGGAVAEVEVHGLTGDTVCCESIFFMMSATPGADH